MKNVEDLTPTIRVEVYIPIRYEPAYYDLLTWVIEEFTRVYGGCTVNENVGGYYLSRAGELIDDRVMLSTVISRWIGTSVLSEQKRSITV